MKKIKLLQNDINKLLLIPDKFKKRDYIQILGIKHFLHNNGKLLCTWATSLGKSVLAVKIIKLLRKQSSKEIHICVPYDSLITQWEEHMKDIPNVKIFIINSYCKLNNPKPLLLIVDECHIGAANESGDKFNRINKFHAQYKLYLSATLKINQKEYIKKTTGIKTEFNIDIKQADLLGFVVPFEILNVEIPFTDYEKEEYLKAIEKEEKGSSFFSYFKYSKCPSLTSFPIFIDPKTQKDITKQAKIIAVNWMKGMSKRCMLIYNAERKLEIFKEIEPLLKGKSIFMSKTKKTANLIQKVNPKEILLYHSEGTKKNGDLDLQKFKNSEYTKISSINKLIQGYDDNSVDTLIRYSFSSTELNGVQSLGRILRVNPLDESKSALMINFIIQPFLHEYVEVEDFIPIKKIKKIIPSDNYWIMISLRNLNYKTIPLEELKKRLNE
jgi:superfamily II DNA or RNA helicase